LVNLSLCMIRPQLRSTLFPYTTLFRSLCERGIRTFEPYTRNTLDLAAIPSLQTLSHLPVISDPSHGTGRRELVEPMAKASVAARSEEHTSELQSRENLVCRLLLEKKKH